MTGPDREVEREAIVAYRQAKDRVADAAAYWAGCNEPRRADRMTADEIRLFDAVAELLAAGRVLRERVDR